MSLRKSWSVSVETSVSAAHARSRSSSAAVSALTTSICSSSSARRARRSARGPGRARREQGRARRRRACRWHGRARAAHVFRPTRARLRGPGAGRRVLRSGSPPFRRWLGKVPPRSHPSTMTTGSDAGLVQLREIPPRLTGERRGRLGRDRPLQLALCLGGLSRPEEQETEVEAHRGLVRKDPGERPQTRERVRRALPSSKRPTAFATWASTSRGASRAAAANTRSADLVIPSRWSADPYRSFPATLCCACRSSVLSWAGGESSSNPCGSGAVETKTGTPGAYSGWRRLPAVTAYAVSGSSAIAWRHASCAPASPDQKSATPRLSWTTA